MRYKRKAQEAYLNSILLATIKSKADFFIAYFLFKSMYMCLFV